MKHSLPFKFSRIKHSVFLVGFLLFLLPELSWGQTELVRWDFPNNPDDVTADGGISANLTKTINTNSGGPAKYSLAGKTTYCASNTGWDSGNDLKYWEVEFTTLGYSTIKVSSKQKSTADSGPKDFKLQYKIGSSGTWADVSSGNIVVGDNAFTTGSLVNIPLPAASENQTSVYLRWIMTSNNAVGGVNQVASSGSSRIDDIIISGTAIPTPAPTATLANLTHSNITKNSADLTAEITSDGGASVSARGFNYGTTNTYGTTINNGTGTGTFSNTLTGLDPNTQYFYQAYATNSNGTATLDGNFTTIPDEPVQTNASATQTSFTINWGSVFGTSTTGYRLDVSTSNTFSSFLTGFQDKSLGNVTTYTVTGLTSGTTYYYRLRTENAGGTSINASYNITTQTCTEPTVAASGVLTPIVKDDKINLSWTNGDGTSRIIIAKAGSAINASDLPVDGFNYTTSSTFGSGAAIGGAFVVYKGTGSSATVFGLTGSTTYYFAVIEYSCTPENYLITAYGSANATTEASSLVRFSFAGATGSEPTFAPDAQPGNALVSSMGRGTGNTASGNSGTFSANSFPVGTSGTFDANNYFKFSITPDPNYKVTLTKLELDETRSSTGIRNWSVRSSLDNFAADIASFSVPDDNNTRVDNVIALTNAFTDLTSAVEFRIYGYDAEGSAGSWKIDNVQAFGTVDALPPTANTTVQFLTTSLKVNEAAGTATVDLVISGESATTATTVDVVLLSGSAADIDNYSTQTITFPAGSAVNQTATFTLTNDLLDEGTETLGFELQNVLGGNAAAAGTQKNFSLKIIDNELPDMYINEFHYENSSTDIGEFVEVVLPATFTDLASVTLSEYNGTTGAVKATHSLSTFTANPIAYGNYKVYYKAISGLGNGPDGFSLDYDNQLIEFITYGNPSPATPITATAGPAVGVQATDVELMENETDPAGSSIFLTQGTGSRRSPGSLNWVWAKQTGSDSRGFPNTNQPLPVELLNFTATAVKNTVELNWATATEKNSNRFEVERSANGKDFTKIAELKAAGNASNVNTYKTIDSKPLAKFSYYRLKQIDLDNTFSYSKIVKAEMVAPYDVKLFPVPATQVLHISLPAAAKIQVINLLGQEVLNFTGKTAVVDLDVSRLPAGSYQLIAEGEHFKTIRKFVKVN